MLASTTKLFANPLKQFAGSNTCRALTQANDINLVNQLEPSHRGISTQDRAPATKPASLVHDTPVSSVGVYFDQFHNYCLMIDNAKALARRSLLVDHCGLNYIDLSSEFHNVERVYEINKETRETGVTRLTLIEFKTEDDAELVSKQARHNLGFLPVPLKILKYSSDSSAESYDKQDLTFPVYGASLSYRRELATNFKSYAELITNNTMTLVDFKMRFITLVNFERVLCAGLFQEYELMPFGSSVIDIGRDFGDLDIVLTRRENHYEFIEKYLYCNDSFAKKRISNTVNTKSNKDECRYSKLVHLDKSLFSEIRDHSGIRGAMRWFDYVLKEYMPLTEGYNVQFLRHAKVPIIKFTSLVTSLDCDLSFNFALDHRQVDVLSTNYSGIIMSQLLYSICRKNNLFSSVIVYLRLFAKLTNITSKEPNIGWTNFQFLSLILFYLQRISVQQVRTLSTTNTKELGNLSRDQQKDEYKIELVRSQKQSPLVPPFKYLLDSRRMSRLPLNLYKFTDDQLNRLIPQVVVGFFEFYSKYDFSLQAINLFEARIDRKLDNSPVYVTNPLDRTRNICHNVNRKGLDNLVQHVTGAENQLTRGDQDPLSLIRNLMVKFNLHQSSFVRHDVYDFRHDRNVTSQEIAQDVFSLIQRRGMKRDESNMKVVALILQNLMPTDGLRFVQSERKLQAPILDLSILGERSGGGGERKGSLYVHNMMTVVRSLTIALLLPLISTC